MVDEAYKEPWTCREDSKVEEAFTKIPLVVEVGESQAPPPVSQAPFLPERVRPSKPSRVPVQSPVSSISVTVRQLVQVTSTTWRSPELLAKVASSVRESKVSASMIKLVPTVRVSVRVVVEYSPPLTVSPVAKVEEALLWKVVFTVRAPDEMVSIREEVAFSPPLTVNPEAKVEEALPWKVAPAVSVVFTVRVSRVVFVAFRLPTVRILMVEEGRT